MSDLPQFPTGGGSFRRDRNGRVATVEQPTQPSIDKIPGSDPIFPDAPTIPAEPETPAEPDASEPVSEPVDPNPTQEA